MESNYKVGIEQIISSKINASEQDEQSSIEEIDQIKQEYNKHKECCDDRVNLHSIIKLIQNGLQRQISSVIDCK